MMLHLLNADFASAITPLLAYPLAALIGYLLGSLNWSIILSRAIYRSDIRRYGSGNAGMTNTLRTYGKSKAALVFVLDALKTVVAVLLANRLVGPQYGAMVGGAAALLGHVYPLYYHFKGGKGVVCGITLITLIDVRMAAAVLGTFLVVLAARRIISLASISGAVAFPLSALIFHWGEWHYFVYALVVGGFVIWLHRENIKRLAKGTEAPIGLKKKQDGKGSSV